MILGCEPSRSPTVAGKHLCALVVKQKNDFTHWHFHRESDCHLSHSPNTEPHISRTEEELLQENSPQPSGSSSCLILVISSCKMNGISQQRFDEPDRV